MCIFIYLFMLQCHARIPLGKAGLLQILSYAWESAQVNTFQAFPRYVQPIPRSVCLLLNVQVAKTPPASPCEWC